jgi:hypothetical protein
MSLPGTFLTIGLHSIKCLDEKNEASASEEVYVLVTVADLRPPRQD